MVKFCQPDNFSQSDWGVWWFIYRRKGSFCDRKMNHLAQQIKQYLHAVQCTLVSKKITQRKKQANQSKHMLCQQWIWQRPNILIKQKHGNLKTGQQKQEALECFWALGSQHLPFEQTQILCFMFQKQFLTDRKRQHVDLAAKLRFSEGKDTFSCDASGLNRDRKWETKQQEEKQHFFKLGATILYQLPLQHKLSQLLK